MTSKSAKELATMRQGGRLLAKILTEVADQSKAGVTLIELEEAAEKLVKKAGAKPAFKGYHGYPYATCLSVNSEVVHGMPRPYALKRGDILGIDIGLILDGLYLDSAVTVGIGRISPHDQRLLKTTYDSLWRGIRKVRQGIPLGDVQAAIQRHVEKNGFTIVRDLCGHGIGRQLQEEPQIPNFGKSGEGPALAVGQTFALEPMVSYRSAHTATKGDGWTVVTLSDDNAAHFEHTVAVTERGVEVLTLRDDEKGGKG